MKTCIAVLLFAFCSPAFAMDLDDHLPPPIDDGGLVEEIWDDLCCSYLSSGCQDLFGGSNSCGGFDCDEVWGEDENGNQVLVSVCVSGVKEATTVNSHTFYIHVCDGMIPNMANMLGFRGSVISNSVKCGSVAPCQCQFKPGLGKSICRSGEPKEFDPITLMRPDDIGRDNMCLPRGSEE